VKQPIEDDGRIHYSFVNFLCIHELLEGLLQSEKKHHDVIPVNDDDDEFELRTDTDFMVSPFVIAAPTQVNSPSLKQNMNPSSACVTRSQFRHDWYVQ
jgi:hypothetical protein